jgi:hypothetical protein
MMTTQEMYSPTNPIRASKTPSAMSIAQIDQALLDFVLQDTAHLRRDAETASRSRREPQGATQMVSDLVRQMAGASLNKLDETIADLSQVRDFLHTEGERIKREISGYLQLNQVVRPGSLIGRKPLGQRRRHTRGCDTRRLRFRMRAGTACSLFPLPDVVGDEFG